MPYSHEYLKVLLSPLNPFHADTFMDSITVCGISALTSGVIAFSCGVLIAIFCNCIIIKRYMAVKKCKENEVSKHPAAVSPLYQQQSDQSPQYEEIPMQEHSQGHVVELQQNIAYVSQRQIRS